MQSLKELRAENAARRLSNSRTANEEEVAGNPVPAAATAAATAPRAGRTLAPLTSTGSLLPSPAATPAADQEDAVQHEDREARRRRRLRRRREREQREKDDGENSKVPVDDNETVLSGASRTSTTAGEEVTGGRAAAAATAAAAADNAFAEQKGGVPSGRRESDSERQLAQEEAVPATEAPLAAERKALDTEKSGVDDAGVGPEKPQLSARRAPPQEKPKKKLTPLEARRARIEQQKRQEIEKARSSDDSPRFVGSEEPREAKSDARSKGGAVDSGSRRPSDDRDQRGGTTTTNQTGQPTKRSSGGGRGTATGKTAALPRSSEDEKEDSGTEHDPLLFPGSVAERKTEDEDDNGSGGGSQPESVNVEKNPGVENDKGTKGGGRADDTLRASTGETLADAAAGDSGRFQGMRSRMKKAGKGLLTKKSSTSSVPRRKKADDAALSGTGGKEGQPSETVEGSSSGDTLPEAGGEGMARGTEDGGEDEHGDQNQTGGPADDSDTASNDSVLSPRRSEVEKDNDFDTESDEGGKGRKKKWGRSKEKSSAEAPLAGDKEVTLGHVVDRKMREMGYIRKPAVDELKNRRSLRDRVAAEGAPEVHFIGEISGAEGFGSGISCRFRVEGGRHWTCLAGLEEGQTHVMHTDFGDEFAPWNHPIDLHYTTKSIQGWPRLMVQVWQLDTHGRNVLRGYGFRHLPSTPGFSEVSVPCWRPSGTMQEETAAFFLGVTPRLTAEDAVFNRAWDQRCRLVTLPAGTVWIHMNGLFCNLQDQGVDSLTT